MRVLPIAREAVMRYLALCPYPQAPGDPLFLGVKGGPLCPGSSSLPWSTCAKLWGYLKPRRRMPCAIPFATHLLQAGPICARSRNC